VTWRDGVHLTGTPIWCDARRRRDVCFVSSADRVGRSGHGQLIASPLTLALLGAPTGGGHLGVPLRRRFTLGTLRLELIASGRGPGASSLHVDIAGKTVLYAGAVRCAVPNTAGVEPAEVRSCDAVVVAAPFAAERFPPIDATVDAAIAWTRAQLAAERRPVLFVDTALDGLEVATCLAREGIPLAGGRTIRELAQRANEHAYEQVLDGAGPLAIGTPGREPRAILWLAADRAGARRAVGARAHATAAVSGHALAAEHGCDAGFAWPSAAGRAELLAWIESANAREVFVTGAAAEPIVHALGPRARVLGPPHQMTLFPREAMP